MVRFAQVTKVFPNGYVGLENVTFAVEPKEFVYIVGESGAGKTTLMRLLIGEFPPTEGEIWVGDENIAQVQRHRIPYVRRQIGVVFQDYKLIMDRTIGENIAVGLEIIGTPRAEVQRQVADMLKLVGLADKDPLFPSQLSGGELQRVAIARALVMAPKVLFADEPTGNLDAETGLGIIALLQKVRELGTTVLVATHDQSVLSAHPGRQLFLKKGKLEEDRPIAAKKETKRGKKERVEETA